MGTNKTWRKTKCNESERKESAILSGGDFLLFDHGRAHPQSEITDVRETLPHTRPAVVGTQSWDR